MILKASDDAAGRGARTRSLRLAGMGVIEAGDGASVLAVIGRRHPGLVLLDDNLPDMGGPEICRRIKAEWPDLIVIQLMAAAAGVARRAAGLDGAADCTLAMPVEPVELIAVARAMLRLRDAEAEAHEHGQRHVLIVEGAVNHAIFTCGLDGRITSWNAGAQAVFGYSHDEVIGQPYSFIFVADDVVEDRPGQELRAAGSDSSVRAERWHRHRDGARFWSSSRMVPLRDRCGNVTAYLKILCDQSVERDARDALEALNKELEGRVAERTRELAAANEGLLAEVVERKQAEERLRQLQKIEALERFTGGFAHDFNNLLAAILGGLEVMRRRIDDPRTLQLIDSSKSAAERGAKLIKQLRAFAGMQRLQVARVALNALVTEALALIEQSVDAGVAVRLDLKPNAWAVLADAALVRAALLHLAANARDAMEAGGMLWISTGDEVVADANDPVLPAGDYGTLTVRDSGTGMSGEVLERLFEPFFTTKGVGKGTGLGLAKVHGFVRQSGGDVRVTSEPGSGTSVTILLPRAADEAAQPAG